MKSSNIENKIKKLNFKGSCEMHNRILTDVLKSHEEFKDTKSASSKPNIWRIIMKTRTTKLVAAAVFIAVIIGLHQFRISIDGTSVAWADVAERLEKVSSFKARAHRVFTEEGKDEPLFNFDVFRYFSPDHGVMEKQYCNGKLVMLSYSLLSKKSFLVVFPDLKQYYRFKFNEEILAMIEYMNPANTDGIMKLFGSERCTRLGKREIDGVIAEGFEVKNVKVFSSLPRFLFQLDDINIRLWVNKETLLPIRMEGEGFIGKGFLTGFKDLYGEEAVYDIEYDVEIDESIFEPNIPDDYILIDPANIAEKAELTMLGILPIGAFAWFKLRRKKQKLPKKTQH